MVVTLVTWAYIHTMSVSVHYILWFCVLLCDQLSQPPPPHLYTNIQTKESHGIVCLYQLFIIFYFYYYLISFASLPFSMANHLGLDKPSYQMVGKWGVICKCSAPVGTPGCIMQIEHHDNISFSRHSQLTRFWEPNLANPVWITMSSTSFKGPESVYLSFMVVFTVWLAQEYMCSCFLHTKYFYLYLYIRWLPTFQMGQVLSGFLSTNSSILKFSSVLHTKVQSDKLSNYIYKASCIRQVSMTSSVLISASFRSPDLQWHLWLTSDLVYTLHVST